MTFNELIDQINTMLSGFGTQVGNDIVGINSTGDAKFSQPGGTWGDSPTTPLTTSTINLSLTNALNAGTACVYYSGNVLTKDSFLPAGSVTFFSGSNRLDVLCAVWITYDKGSGAFHVNIQDTWTGAIPEPPTDETLATITVSDPSTAETLATITVEGLATITVT